MAILSSDADGFLTGPRIDDNALTDELGDIRDSLNGIEAGVKSIEALLVRAGIKAAGEAQRRVVGMPVGGGTPQNGRQVKPEIRTPKTAGERGGESEKKIAARRHPVETEGGSIGATKKAALPTEAHPKTKRGAADGPRVTSSGHKTAEPRVRHTSQKAAAGTESATNRVGNAAPQKKGEDVSANAPATAPMTAAAGTPVEPAPRKRKRKEDAEAAEAKTPVRDSKGRFIGKGASSGDEGFFNGSAAGEEERSATLLAGKIADAVVEGTEGLGDADPTVQAINEVATPISRGFGFLKEAWGEDEDAGWLRKIYRGLGRFHKEQSAFNVAEKKQLKAIASNTDGIDEIGRGGKDGGGLIGGWLGNLKGLLGGIVPALAMFAKRIPIIGAVFAGAKGIFDVFDSEWDERLDRSQKDKKTGKAIGGAGGTIAGGFAGAKAGALVGAAFGPIGAAIGGVVGSVAGMWFGKNAGDILGETIGGWVTTLRGVPDMIVNAWNGAVASIQTAWSGVTESISTTWNGAVASVQGAWTGAVESAQATWDSVATSVSVAWDGAVGAIQSAWDSALSGFGKLWNGAKKSVTEGFGKVNDWIADKTGVDIAGAVTEVTKSVSRVVRTITAPATKKSAQSSPETPAGEWQLGQTSSYFESGGRGAGVISSGRGDHGGKSYGTYQLSSRAGTLQDFVKNGGYSDRLTARVGTAEFDKQWKGLAANDPAFAQAQHDYIKRTHYDKAANSLAMTGIDLSGRGKAVQDMLWSTSVQFGAGSAAEGMGGAGLVRRALHGKDASSMSDAEIIEAVQNYKLANNDKLFASSSANVRKGTARRAALEKERLLKLNGFENGAQNPAAKRVAQTVGLASPDKERDESNREIAQADAQAKMLFAGTLDKTQAEAIKRDPLKRAFVNDIKGAPKDLRPTVENAEKWAERRKERRVEAMDILHSKRRAAAEAKAAETAGISEGYAQEASKQGAEDRLNALEARKRAQQNWPSTRESPVKSAIDQIDVEPPKRYSSDFVAVVQRNMEKELAKQRSAEHAQKIPSISVQPPRLSTPPAPVVPSTPPAPAMEAPLASNDKQGGAVTVRLQNETPQDVKDRAIALVATGGYSGGN